MTKTRRGLLAGLGTLILGTRAASAQTACPAGQSPNRKGDCSCPSGTDPCPNGCFDRKRDPNNCGTCGNVCPAGTACVKGECRCPSGTAQCGATCCADCFGEHDLNSGGTVPICCPSTSVCAGATGAQADDQCCWFDEVCLAPNTPCCRSDANGGCVPETNCAGCCRACGTDQAGNPVCCGNDEGCVTDQQSGQQSCEFLNTARLSRSRL